MLSHLSIRDIVLIEKLDIEFRNGLSVLTGETGAGKSILLDSLALAMGGRGDGNLVRKGAEEGIVTASFEPERGHPIFRLLKENGIDDDDLLILRRVQKSDGKTKAYVNGTPVPAGLLRRMGQQLVEIHGQHDDRAMLDAATHRSLLDAYAGLEPDIADVHKAWIEWRDAEKALRMLKADIEEAQREGDYLRASVEELRTLSPEPGEEEQLADQRQRMMRMEQVATDLGEANETLSGNGSPVTVISNVARQLERKREQAPELVAETVEHLDSALNALYAAQNTLETAVYNTEFDPKELEQSEERLFALRAAARKFSIAVENLPDLAVRMEDALSNLEEGEEKLQELERHVNEAKARFFDLSGHLSGKRTSAGTELASAVMAELPELKLERAIFMVRQETNEAFASASGTDQIEFWVQTNPGSNAGSMRKVASGGELSRFMLALKVALADRGSAPTLIFDEIDAGVGGAVADAIGQRLERLARKVQVLSVTHAPQVAARALGHYLISKDQVGKSERVATQVTRIHEQIRLEEIARMLSGATVTQEARAAAEKLLEQTAA